MAKIHPENPEVRTNGEDKVISFFMEHLDDSWELFYEPLISHKKPDLVLFSDQFGIIVIEIKDFIKSNIKILTPTKWTIFYEGRLKQIHSPFLQAQNYVYEIVNRLEEEEGLLSSEHEHKYKGRLNFPIVPACFFTNLTSLDIEDLGINKVIPIEFILTFDLLDLHTFSSWVQQLFTKHFWVLESDISEKKSNIIRNIIYPELETNIDNTNSLIKEVVKNLPENTIKKIKVNEFESMYDELLFMATEIRYLIKKNIFPISILYYKNRNIKEGSLKDKIEEVMTLLGIDKSKIFISSLSELNNKQCKANFIIDFNSVKSKDVLTLFDKVSTPLIYLSYNRKTELTKILKKKFC